MTNATAYLFFGGNCSEAMAFYKECLGGDLTLLKVSDTPIKDSVPEEFHNRIMHASLEGGGVDFFASDWLSFDTKMVSGNNVSMLVSKIPKDKATQYFTRLSEGASRIEPIGEQFFGSFGSLTDKFGTNWMILTE